MTPERLAELKRTRMFYAADASGDIAIICELLDHVATLEGFQREALAARNLLRFYGVLVQPLSKTDREARATLYRQARAANTTERTTPHAE